MDVSPEEIKGLCPRFRILIMGRRNAGKTTILEKMTGSEAGVEPEIRDKAGNLVDDPAQLKAGVERGMSNIEYEITYPNNPLFVFHDSRGIEAGAEADEASELRIEYIRAFIDDRAQQARVKDQLHAIWFCMPMDNVRVPSDSFELAFFEKGTGSVPVIAVLTKYEALVDRISIGRPEQDKAVIKSYLHKNILDPIKKAAHPPAAYVQTHHKGVGCELLTEKTYGTIKNDTLATFFAMAQRNSQKVSCEAVFRRVLRQSDISRLGETKASIRLVVSALQLLPFWSQFFLLEVSCCPCSLLPSPSSAPHFQLDDFDYKLFDGDLTLKFFTDDRFLWYSLLNNDAAKASISEIAPAITRWLDSGPIHILDLKIRVQFVTFACLLGCWTSHKSRKPWEYITQAIRKVDIVEDLRVHIVDSVQTALQQYDINSKELYESLAQLVLRSANTLGPDEAGEAQPS